MNSGAQSSNIGATIALYPPLLKNVFSLYCVIDGYPRKHSSKCDNISLKRDLHIWREVVILPEECSLERKGRYGILLAGWMQVYFLFLLYLHQCVTESFNSNLPDFTRRDDHSWAHIEIISGQHDNYNLDKSTIYNVYRYSSREINPFQWSQCMSMVGRA